VARNRSRDVVTRQQLEAAGWKVLVLWECELRNESLVLKTTHAVSECAYTMRTKCREIRRDNFSGSVDIYTVGVLPHESSDIRKTQLATLTSKVGVYALCDLDQVPIYVGAIDRQYTVQELMRHLTSARSDVIANRQLDVWEVAFVWAWPMPRSTIEEIGQVESYLANDFHRTSH